MGKKLPACTMSLTVNKCLRFV